jgi:hypothetical protein
MIRATAHFGVCGGLMFGGKHLDDGVPTGYVARHLGRVAGMSHADVGAAVGHTRPAPRSQDTKAAIEYLKASGATAITITEHDGVCSFHIGHRIDPHAVSIQWVPEAGARAIIRQARRNAGANPDAATAAKALEDGFLNETCGAPKQLNLRLYLGKVPPRFPA